MGSCVKEAGVYDKGKASCFAFLTHPVKHPDQRSGHIAFQYNVSSPSMGED
jgi:hypothetical protein